MSVNPGQPANGTAFRLAELERRMSKAEDHTEKIGVIVQRVDGVDEHINGLASEVRQLRRVLIGLLATIAGSAAIFALVSQAP